MKSDMSKPEYDPPLPITKLDAEKMLLDRGWPRGGFQHTRACLLERIDRASDLVEKKRGIYDWHSWIEDERERHHFAARMCGEGAPGLYRDAVLDVIAPSIAEALDELREEVRSER